MRMNGHSCWSLDIREITSFRNTISSQSKKEDRSTESKKDILESRERTMLGLNLYYGECNCSPAQKKDDINSEQRGLRF